MTIRHRAPLGQGVQQAQQRQLGGVEVGQDIMPANALAGADTACPEWDTRFTTPWYSLGFAFVPLAPNVLIQPDFFTPALGTILP